MSRVTRHLTFVLGAALLVAPALAAQPGRGAGERGPQGAGPRGRMQGPGGLGGATALLDARRQLDLTPRQVAQLDSLERVQVAERKALAERLRPVRDSVAQRARTDQRTPASRDSLRAQARSRMEATRPLLEQQRKRDSSLNAAAERVLNDTQRQKVREMRAERRGYERGLRERGGPDRGPARVQGGRAGRGRGGVPEGMPGGMRGPQGPGMRGPQGQGMRGPQGPRGPQPPGAPAGRPDARPQP